MATWLITDESCNIDFKRSGVSIGTYPKELITLQIVLAGEPLNDTTVDNVFVVHDGKYGVELPYNDVTIGVTSYASAELLRAAIAVLINSNPCASGGGGGGENLDQTLAIGNTTTLSAIFDDGVDSSVVIAPTGIVMDVQGVALSIADSTTGATALNINVNGTFSIGDDTGTIGTPFIFASPNEITISGAGGTEYFHTDVATHTAEIHAADAVGIIRFQTTVPGVALTLDNGLKTVDMLLDGGSFTIKDVAASTSGMEVNSTGAIAVFTATDEIVITSLAINDGASAQGIDFSATAGPILFPDLLVMIGTADYNQNGIASAAGYTISANGTLRLATVTDQNIQFLPDGTGVVTATDATGTFILTSDGGWTASTVTTTLKTGLSDGSTLGNVLSYLRALENHIFGTMSLIHA